MSLFRISGKMEKDGKWSDQYADFGGYFVRDSKGIIQGYVVEYAAGSRESKHLIAGIHENDNIVFVKMLPCSTRNPMCFVQTATNPNGYWDFFFPIGGGFFANRTFQGHASLSISEAQNILQEEQISQLFADFVKNNASFVHLGLLEDLADLRLFWEDDHAPHD